MDLGVTTGFVHISEVSWDQVNDLVERFGIGEEVSAKIIEKDSEKHKLKLSIKQLSQDPWEIFLSSHKIGDVVTAEVKEILDFGLIVSVDGNNGFVHVSELAWHNGAKALKNYNVNDKIEAKIIQIEEDRKNVKLSVKQLEENPWEKVKEKYQIGEVLERPITEVFDFGILVSLEKDIEGLLHISDISYRKVTNLTSKYNVGDIIKFKIIDFNDEKNRVSLSSKALLDDKWEKIEDNYDFNSTLSGKNKKYSRIWNFCGIGRRN